MFVDKPIKKIEPQPQVMNNSIKPKPLPIVDTEKELKKINKIKQIYFSTIRKTIDKNKIYPRVAIKRAIEGSVKIKFTLTKNRELLSFNILEGKKIFKKSIEKAIKKSFPIIPPRDIFKENLDLFLTLNYKLY